MRQQAQREEARQEQRRPAEHALRTRGDDPPYAGKEERAGDEAGEAALHGRIGKGELRTALHDGDPRGENEGGLRRVQGAGPGPPSRCFLFATGGWAASGKFTA